MWIGNQRLNTEPTLRRTLPPESSKGEHLRGNQLSMTVWRTYKAL